MTSSTWSGVAIRTAIATATATATATMTATAAANLVKEMEVKASLSWIPRKARIALLEEGRAWLIETVVAQVTSHRLPRVMSARQITKRRGW